MTAIRTGAFGDEVALAKLNAIVQDLHVQHRPDQFRPTQLEQTTEWFRSLFEKSDARVWIAEDDGRPVGYLVASFHHIPANAFVHARHLCEITQIGVEPAHRRRGIARSLVSSAIAAARADGIQRIEASSWSFNQTTHEVFRRLGFSAKLIRFELQSPG